MDLINSRRFWVAVGNVVTVLVIHFVPELDGSEEYLSGLFTTLAVLLVLGYSLEDVAHAVYLGKVIASRTKNTWDDMAASIAEAAVESQGGDVPDLPANGGWKI